MNEREVIQHVEDEYVADIVNWVALGLLDEVRALVRREVLDVTGTREEFMERYSSYFSDEERGK